MSRDPDRIDFTLHVLGEYWRRHPDLRLGQIIGNTALLIGIDSYAMEDDDFTDQLMPKGVF